jgi:hypothetical protein
MAVLSHAAQRARHHLSSWPLRDVIGYLDHHTRDRCDS